MKRIFKYKLPINGEEVKIPDLVIKWLSVDTQSSWPYGWAIVDDEVKSESTVVAWGTGWPAPKEEAEYLGTVQHMGFVWHYFRTVVE